MKRWLLLGSLGGLFLTGCTSNQNTLPGQTTSETTTNGQNAGTSSNRHESSSSAASTAASSTMATADPAAAVSLSELGIKLTVTEAIASYQAAYPDTAITELSLDSSLGGYYYELTGVDDMLEYEVKIDAETGALVKEQEEQLDQDEQGGVEKQNKALTLTGLLTLSEATAIAQQTVGAGEAVEWSLDRELKTTYWEVTVKNGRRETTVKLDAQSGDVLETEIDD